MNAFNAVNLSAACVLTSTDYAKEIGIPEDRWVYVLGGAGTHERDHCKIPQWHLFMRQILTPAVWERSHFHQSPAIGKALDAALNVSGLTKDEVDCFDFYS